VGTGHHREDTGSGFRPLALSVNNNHICTSRRLRGVGDGRLTTDHPGTGDDQVRGTEDYVQTTGTSAEPVVTSPTADLNAVPENVGRKILFSFTLPAPAGCAVRFTLM
jgi:hypothetical protein